MYFRDLIPRLVEDGDDGNCGSSAVCDTICLQVCISTNLFFKSSLLKGKWKYYDVEKNTDKQEKLGSAIPLILEDPK